jgi:hypothetical protein
LTTLQNDAKLDVAVTSIKKPFVCHSFGTPANHKTYTCEVKLDKAYLGMCISLSLPLDIDVAS